MSQIKPSPGAPPPLQFGLGTMLGAIVGGLVLGLAESFSATYIGPTYPNAISFGLLVLILIVRPTGILGRRG